jgi:hypothetical protein
MLSLRFDFVPRDETYDSTLSPNDQPEARRFVLESIVAVSCRHDDDFLSRNGAERGPVDVERRRDELSRRVCEPQRSWWKLLLNISRSFRSALPVFSI